jgi:hypothetical protein
MSAMIEKIKTFMTIVLCVVLTLGFNVQVVHAKDDDGKIDLYEVFSSKTDKLKTEVGSNIYKWSMHLPDDGVIYKSDKANLFNMSSTSYQATIELTVEKNEQGTTLEELLYLMQNQPAIDSLYYEYRDNEYVMDIVYDTNEQRYIKVIKADQMYDYYLVNEAARKEGDYIENRIYIANNYIYNLTVTMVGTYYRQHQEMFDKLISSFKLSFDNNNPYIKELSDSVSSTREYKNNSYGWKLTMSPYWRLEGTPNARVQQFGPVYSDEELEMNKKDEENKKEFEVQEGITVSLISSAAASDTVSNWALKELSKTKKNINSGVYEILANKSEVQGGLNVQHLVIRYKTITNNPYIVHNMYVIGNGYKYLVAAVMKEEKYSKPSKRSEFENMLNSFTLDKSSLNKHLGKIVAAEDLVNLDGLKTLKLNKYEFSTKLTQNWNTQLNRLEPYYEKYYEDYSVSYNQLASNNECVSALDTSSNMYVTLNAGLNAKDIKETIKMRVEELINNDEVQIGLAEVNIKSTEYEGAQIYYIGQNYDLNAIQKFVKEDKTKIYDLRALYNRYDYVVKIGNDIYSESITLPVANSTAENERIAEGIWKDTLIKKKNYGSLKLNWVKHSLEDFGSKEMKEIMN